jgi:rfaE bifunctional protein kinase chain/domain/rfaE bifunctional protein nucleotidyltransferase chain/domain
MSHSTNKILSRTDLLKELGEFSKREKKVVMCHGVFDVVHPGHIRHLDFAKSISDVLVVSITDDMHITKGVYRPHVSAAIRAKSLAHLQMVDYIIINEDPTPVSLIKNLEPDFFAKGFEYVSNGLPPATQEESDAVTSYGGQLVFTPGDLVYSSSQLIELSPPDLTWERIQVALDSSKMEWDDLAKILQYFSKITVTVLGDTIIDSILLTSIYGTSNKTPTLSVLEEARRDYLGGAAIVALHMKAAGANVKFITTIGNDELGNWAKTELEKAGIELVAFNENGRPTTQKMSIVCAGQRLLKIDKLDNRPLAATTQTQIERELVKSESDVVVFSDFRHGVFNKNSIQRFIEAIKPIKFKVADSQVASRWGNIAEFENFDLITPNEKEARFALGDQDSTVHRLAINLIEKTQCKNILLKLGEKGLLAAKPQGDKTGAVDFFGFGAFATNVEDAVGSGDALLAYATLALAVGLPLPMSAILGNIAASVQCSRIGNIPIHASELAKELEDFKQRFEYQVQ